jgi:hypothetical protein
VAERIVAVACRAGDLEHTLRMSIEDAKRRKVHAELEELLRRQRVLRVRKGDCRG